MKRYLVQLLGPTGVGKSRVAIWLARELGGEVISADAFQVYRGFDIGTDKLPESERQGVPHHMIDIISDCSQFNAWRFLQLSHRASEEIQARGRLPIVCGGTALYLKVQLQGIFQEIKDEGQTRESLRCEERASGLAPLWDELARVDPDYAQKIGPRDRVRILRALEIYRLNGRPPSALFAKSETPFAGYRVARIGLRIPRDLLYRRIEERVENMISAGLIEEVKSLRCTRPSHCPPFRALGYREMGLFLDGAIGWSEAIALIKRNSRRFAKRQLTWFRQEKEIAWFAPEHLQAIAAHLREKLWNEP